MLHIKPERKTIALRPRTALRHPPLPSWSRGLAGEGGSVLPLWPVRGLRLPGEVPASPGLVGGSPENCRPAPFFLPLPPPPPRVLPEPSGLIPAPPSPPPPSYSRFARFPGGVQKSKVATAARGLCPGEGGAVTGAGTAWPCGGGWGGRIKKLGFRSPHPERVRILREPSPRGDAATPPGPRPAPRPGPRPGPRAWAG